MRQKSTEPIPFLHWKREGNEIVCLATQEFKGWTVVHLRTYSRGAKGKLYATERGVTIPHQVLKPLRRALRKVEKELAREKDQNRSKMGSRATPPWTK